MVLSTQAEAGHMVGKIWPEPIEQRLGQRLGGRRERVEYDIARCREDVIDAWRLVYHSYYRAGFIKSNPYEIHTVPQTSHKDAAVFLRRVNRCIASTICMMPDGERGLPLDSVYPDELDAVRADGRQMVELGLFADRNGGLAPSSFAEFYSMFRLMFSYAVMQGASDIICGTHPRRARVLQRFFGLNPVGEVRSYPFDHSNQPVIMLRGDIYAVLDDPKKYRQMHHLIDDPVDPRFYRNRMNLDTDWTIEAAILRATLAA